MPPLQRLSYRNQVFVDEFDDGGEGIVVREIVEIQGAAQEIGGAVGDIELNRRSRLATLDVVI